MRDAIVDAVATANREWLLWGGHAWNVRHEFAGLAQKDKDDDEARARYILNTYCPAAEATPTVEDIQKDEFAWSAVFMSYVFKASGFEKAEFPFSVSHSTWIRRAVKAQRGKEHFRFHAHRISDPLARPRVGDLIAYARPDKDGEKLTFDDAQTWFDRRSNYKSHSDLVVAEGPQEIQVIGGNVKDSVLKKVIPLNTSGLIADRSFSWFAVLRYQGS
ncbi:DUF2272 domain-containing protein [Variovorax paradoxus]|uniref:DUF2272 domain-containing protein n=1 Tax=Variovorax paradoxus TaxID=34073 RepID=UPI003D645993